MLLTVQFRNIYTPTSYLKEIQIRLIKKHKSYDLTCFRYCLGMKMCFLSAREMFRKVRQRSYREYFDIRKSVKRNRQLCRGKISRLQQSKEYRFLTTVRLLLWNTVLYALRRIISEYLHPLPSVKNHDISSSCKNNKGSFIPKHQSHIMTGLKWTSGQRSTCFGGSDLARLLH